MPIQLTYGFDYQNVQKGQAVETGPSRDVTGYSTQALDFGIGLAYDGASVDESFRVKVPNRTSDVLIGISKKILKQPRGLDSDFLSVVTSTTQVARYEVGDSVTIRTFGQAWVASEQAVAPSDPVFLRCITNGSLLAGDFRKDADNATISNVALTSNVATITTSAAHGLVVGQVVTIAGLTNTALNGTYTITTVPTTTTFTFARTNSNIASTADSGTIARAILVPNAKWISNISSASLALVELY
jgi:hypothetical protein